MIVAVLLTTPTVIALDTMVVHAENWQVITSLLAGLFSVNELPCATITPFFFQFSVVLGDIFAVVAVKMIDVPAHTGKVVTVLMLTVGTSGLCDAAQLNARVLLFITSIPPLISFAVRFLLATPAASVGAITFAPPLMVCVS